MRAVNLSIGNIAASIIRCERIELLAQFRIHATGAEAEGGVPNRRDVRADRRTAISLSAIHASQ